MNKTIFPYKMPSGKTNILQALDLADAKLFLSSYGGEKILFCEVESHLISNGACTDDVFSEFYDESTGYST